MRVDHCLGQFEAISRRERERESGGSEERQRREEGREEVAISVPIQSSSLPARYRYSLAKIHWKKKEGRRRKEGEERTVVYW